MLLSLQPWRRAPLLLLRRRPVAVVLAAAAAVLAAAAASGPLFVSSAADATFAQQLTTMCQPTGGIVISGVDHIDDGGGRADPVVDRQLALNGHERVALVGRVPHLAPPLRELSMRGIPVGTSDVHVTVMSKTGDLRHVVPTAGRVPSSGDPAPGEIWLADTVADELHLHVADAIAFGASSFTVGGVFKDLNRTATAPFWCNDDTLIHAYGNAAAFPFAIADATTTIAMATAVSHDLTDLGEWPIDAHPFPVEAGPALETTLDRLVLSVPARLLALREKAFATWAQAHPTDPRSQGGDLVDAELAATHAHLPIDRGRFVAEVLPSTVTPITLAAVVVALLLVGGAGSFWFERRRGEVDVLLAHGVSPTALGLKAVLEALIPFTVGGVAGWFAGRLLVAEVGPSHLLSRQSQVTSAGQAAVAVGIGALTLGLVATRRCQRREQASIAGRTSVVRLTGRLIAGLVVVGVGVALSGVGISATSDKGGAVARVQPVVLVAPLVGFVVAAAIVARALVGLLRSQRDRGDRLGASWWLAWRRLTGLPGAAALLAAAVALPTAVGTYGAIVSSSVQRTLADQDRIRIGADLVLNLPKAEPVPLTLRDRGTVVLRQDHPSFSGTPVSVIAVDPAAFARDAFWDREIPGPQLPSLVPRLTDGGPGAPLKALITGSAPEVPSLTTPDGAVPVDVVGSRPFWPAAQGGYPVVIVNRTAFERVSTAGLYQLWIHGDVTSALDAVAAAKVAPTYTYDADKVTDGSYLQPVTYTFAFLDALVTLIATVAGGALLLYLDGRSRTRRVEYVLARRMGLTRRAHLWSIGLELLTAMFAGLLAGVAFAVVATVVLSSRFSVDPTLPPDTVLSHPWGAVGVDLVVLVIVALVATLAAQRSIDRVPPSEVLREA